MHCLFEQSGTFKNEFRKLGYEAYDYDIQNEFGETDYVIDLFEEIRKGYDGKPSIFDTFGENDYVFAFFPCTRFSSKIPVWLRGEAPQQVNWSDEKKLQYSMNMQEELSELYQLICKMAYIAFEKGIKMIIENPYDHAHYLTMYWCLKPMLVDKDRTKNGDYFKKPTQYYFLNCCPKNNLVFEPLDWVQQKWVKHQKNENGVKRQVMRSMIHPQYANRFIRKYLIDDPTT